MDCAGRNKLDVVDLVVDNNYGCGRLFGHKAGGVRIS